MATAKITYSAQSADIASGLNSLANGSVATSSAVDNSSNLYTDYDVEIYIDGTAATNAYLEVRIACSQDGTNFGTWESAIPVGTIDLSVDLQRATVNVANYLSAAPKYFKVLVKNSTGAALASSGNYIKWMGKYYTIS